MWALDVLAEAHVEVTMADDGAHVAFVLVPHAAIDRVDAPPAPELSRLRALVGGAFEPRRIAHLAAAIQDSYVEAGYADARVRVSRARAPGVALCVRAEIGPRVTIGAIRFPGRAHVPEADLVRAIGNLHVSSAADDDHLELAELEIRAVYWNQGFARATVDVPRVTREGGHMDIEFPIDEGEVYALGAVRVAGIAGASPPALATGEVFSQDRIDDARDVLAAKLEDREHEMVVAETSIDDASRRIDVTFEVMRL